MSWTDDDAAIEVSGLGKRYQLGTRAGAGSLYDAVARMSRRGSHDEPAGRPMIWALRDVSFRVPRGQVLAVLGRNGSGKSTLMKILARVTAPSEGWAVVRGRVGALLQVGAGFHPELTGRDNIGLSGAILGMSRAEIRAVEDEIIAFAEIEGFLDTPVKHYSSGMFTRLAFSVSAHLRAEVMLVDEVLSVGDMAFQAKCKRRIREVVADGRTVLFVSHNMPSVRELCDTGMVLDGGRVRLQGTADEAADDYERLLATG